ncbi:CAP domain-containing protein [Alphaproteobacteria bacterium]|nr:CAP domain-containing protein [Alphaproteobacteria bacterium]
MGLRGLVAAALALVITGCSATSASERTNTATNTATSPTGNQAGSGAFIAASATTLDLDQLDDVLVAELQTFRTTQGMATLKRDAQLDAAAQALATVMARKNDLSHSADGQRAGDRIEDAGYVLCTQGAPWAENIARSSQFGTTVDLANTIMTGWINSPGHRKNMVGAFAEVGLAVAETSDGSRVYAAQVFATPGPGRCL